MMSGSTIRAFLAVEVTAEIRAALVGLRRELERSGAAVRWVGDDKLHATVKFLGGVSEAALPAVHAALSRALAATPLLTVVVRGLGVFPNARRPRIVWVGLDCPPLGEVAAAVDLALESLGFAKESRAFRPHITLGRVSQRTGWARLAAALQAHAADELGRCELGELIGYRSDLRPDGAVYTKLWTVPFGG